MNAKRIFDIVCSLLLLSVTAPVMLVIALLIKLSSKGPVLYKANRMGKDRVRFTMYKFRSMRVNYDEVQEITMREDARIYPLGRFLRLTKLDELPQLFNILKGDMSIVGPRPEDYGQAMRWYTGKYREIFTVKPGLTSPASLFDYTHGEKAGSVEEYRRSFLFQKLEIDLFYIQNYNFFYDIAVLFHTAWVMLCIPLGRKSFPYPIEYRALYQAEAYHTAER